MKKASCFVNVENAPVIMPIKGLETKILTGLHGEEMMMVLSTTLPGHTVPLHSHTHEQIGLVYGGKALLRIGNEERVAQKGDFYNIPSGVSHGDTCIGEEPFTMLDIFYPIREDFIQKLKTAAEQKPKGKKRALVRPGVGSYVES